MPYHWIDYTKRTYTHRLAKNEVISGHCGIVASDKLYNDHDLSWLISKGTDYVTVELRNYGTKFCFGNRDFGAGCVVDRNICAE